MFNTRIHLFTLIALFFTIILSSCTKPDKPIHSTFAIEDQISLGERINTVIRTNPKDFPLVNFSQIPTAKQYLASRLNTALRSSEVKHYEDFNWELGIIQNDSLSTAVTLPGGFIYLTTGLLKNYVESGAEFVNLIAHEVGYTDQGLVVEMLETEYSLSLLLDVALGNNDETAQAIVQLLLVKPFSDETVDKADLHASTLVCDTDFDAAGLITFLDRVVASTQTVGWLTTRPNNDFRVTNIQSNINSLNCPGVKIEDVGYKNFVSQLP